MNMQAVAMDADLLPVKFRFDFDLRGIKDLRVDIVVEVDQHRLPGRAFLFLVVIPVALVLGHLQGGEGAEGEGLLLGCLQRTLERRQPLVGLDLHAGGGRKMLSCEEGHPAVFGRRGEDLLRPSISVEVGLGSFPERVFFRGGSDGNVFNDRIGVDSLVEDQDHHRVDLLRAALGVDGDDGRRGSAEGPGDRLLQLCAAGAPGSPGDLHLVDGGHREAGLSFRPPGLEEQGLCSDPSPDPFDRGREYDRQLFSGEGFMRIQRHHRIGEGHAEMRCQGQASFRLVAQHLDLGIRGNLDTRHLLRRREDLLDVCAGHRRRQG